MSEVDWNARYADALDRMGRAASCSTRQAYLDLANHYSRMRLLYGARMKIGHEQQPKNLDPLN